LESTIAYLKTVIEYCEAVLPGLDWVPSKKGRRGLGWYDHFIEVILQVAAHLGINPSTDARSVRVADVTPFTVLVFEVEKIFPKKGHSKTAVACARRIERSLKRLREARQNSPEVA
jgi:hypothetical protein